VVTGLLNRLSEANVESIASEISSLFQVYGRRSVTEIVTTEIIGACCGGPRGNDQYAAVFAAYVAGTAAMVGMDFGAKFFASLATAFEVSFIS
jgi:nucleolar MIF4G domain-containing protein 1